jgi:thioredoxin reductase
VPGSFAAGDVGSAKRYATAVGGGGMAVKFVNHILKQES